MGEKDRVNAMSAPKNLEALSLSIEELKNALVGQKNVQDELSHMKSELSIMKDTELTALKSDLAALREKLELPKKSANAEAWEAAWSGVNSKDVLEEKIPDEEFYAVMGTLIRGFVKCNFRPHEMATFIERNTKGALGRACMAAYKGVLDTSTGQELTFAPFLASAFVPLLRDDNDLFDLGATVLNMSNGSLTYPVQTAGAVGRWVPRTGNSCTTNTFTFDRVTLTARKLRVDAMIGEDLLEISDLDVQRKIVMDIFGAIKEALFTTGIQGDGTEDSPKGIINMEGTTNIQIDGYMTADLINKYPAQLKRNKVRFNKQNASFVMDSDVENVLMNLKTNTGHYHFREEMDKGTLRGYRYRVATNLSRGSAMDGATAVETAKLVFGVWSEMQVGVQRNDFRMSESKEAMNGTSNAWCEDAVFMKAIAKLDLDAGQKKAFIWSDDIWLPA